MGRLINGRYEKGDFPMQDAVPSKTSVWKQGDHDRQRADHKRDLIKPYDSHGNLTSEFIEQYPAEAVQSYGFDPNANLELKKE